MSDQIVTLSQIESHLWESANILRGPVDAADFKTFIFPQFIQFDMILANQPYSIKQWDRTVQMDAVMEPLDWLEKEEAQS